MLRHELSFCFKGDRDYVHGPDIYNAVVAWASAAFSAPVGAVDLIMHLLISRNATLVQLQDGERAPADPGPAAILRMDVEGVRQTFFLVENERTVTCRHPYDEESIVAGSTVDRHARSLTFRNETAYSTAQVLVALNKRLVQSLVPGAGKWYVTRFVVPRPLPPVTDCDVRLELTAVMGERLTRTALYVAGEWAGEMYFARAAAT